MGFPYGATASHCVSLGVQPPEVAASVAERVAAARVAVVCNPQTNLFLQARGQRSAPVCGLTALRPLLEAGVTVAAGGDNLRDPFNSVGRADPLETASLLVAAGHLRPDEAYAAVSGGARAAMGLPEVQVAAGFPAELLAVQASSLGEAIAGGTNRIVIHPRSCGQPHHHHSRVRRRPPAAINADTDLSGQHDPTEAAPTQVAARLAP
jgi:cytosine deaminase